MCGNWINLPIPAWAKAVAAWKAPSDAGVGDTFHRLATKVGANHVSRLVAWFGIDCGCEGRRELWNVMYPYAN